MRRVYPFRKRSSVLRSSVCFQESVSVWDRSSCIGGICFEACEAFRIIIVVDIRLDTVGIAAMSDAHGALEAFKVQNMGDELI